MTTWQVGEGGAIWRILRCGVTKTAETIFLIALARSSRKGIRLQGVEQMQRVCDGSLMRCFDRWSWRPLRSRLVFFAVPISCPVFGESALYALLIRSSTVARKLSLAFLAVASPVMLLLFLGPWSWADEIFALLVMGYPVALIVVAVGRRGTLGPLGVPLLFLLIFLEACAIGMLALRGQVVDGPWFGGLPGAAAIQLYGLFLTPLLLVTLAYALTFDKFEMTDDDLERLAEHQRRHEDGS